MKIAFLVSLQAYPEYNENYTTILDNLIKQGHTVHHLLSFSEKTISNLSHGKKESIFINFYKAIRESDLIVAECSFPSINIGYEICHALQHEKQVIILQSNDQDLPFRSTLLYTDKNSYVYTYTKKTLPSILKKAISA
jgi:hypothetical protein